MHGSGVYLYGDEKTSRNTGGSSYQDAAQLVRDFYEEYKDVIIESRKNHNIDDLFKKIGKENFMAFNGLVHEYLEYFVRFQLYNTIEAMQAGIESDDTRFYNEATRRSLEIRERIAKHSIESGFRL